MTPHQSADALKAWRERVKGQPAPPYLYDETGIAHRALMAREWKRRCEWYEEYNDEVIY